MDEGMVYDFIQKEVMSMKATARKIDPEEFILSALPREERIDAAFALAREAFKKTGLSVADIEMAVRAVRSKAHGKRT